MKLLDYFETDDGSLPEIEVTFAEPSHVCTAFKHLFVLGATTANVPTLRLKASPSDVICKPWVVKSRSIDIGAMMGSGCSKKP